MYTDGQRLHRRWIAFLAIVKRYSFSRNAKGRGDQLKTLIVGMAVFQFAIRENGGEPLVSEKE